MLLSFVVMAPTNSKGWPLAFRLIFHYLGC